MFDRLVKHATTARPIAKEGIHNFLQVGIDSNNSPSNLSTSQSHGYRRSMLTIMDSEPPVTKSDYPDRSYTLASFYHAIQSSVSPQSMHAALDELSVGSACAAQRDICVEVPNILAIRQFDEGPTRILQDSEVRCCMHWSVKGLQTNCSQSVLILVINPTYKSIER
jgi:hypothetical protein